MIRAEITKTVDDWSNSFLRPHIPPKLLSSSTITKTEDDGAKLIYAKFLYGEITGQFKHIPFDGSYGNIIDDISQQSLWIYSFDKDKFPSGFEALTYNPGIIRTGKVQKCGYCSGHGKVTCTKCKGRVRWSEKDLFSDKIIDKVCSCGDGKQLCRDCDGYGEVETVIEVKKSFRLFETKNSQYHGEVPEDKIKKITGHPIFEEVIEYPMNDVKEMLLGGINTEEFNELNNTVLDIMHEKVDNELADKGVNTKLIHEQINTLFKSVPNPGRDNKLLEKEVMPIRVMVKVEDAPVTQIDYSFKEKEYSIWLFGNENRIWYQTAPFSFNYKMITLTVLFLLIVGGGIFNYFNNKSFQNKSIAEVSNMDDTSANVKDNSLNNNQPETNINNNLTIISTKSFKGNVGKLDVIYKLNWYSDGTIEGIYNYPSQANSQYTLKGKDLGNGNIELTEYTSSNISAKAILTLDGKCYTGQIKNTDGRQLTMTMCSDASISVNSTAFYILNVAAIKDESLANIKAEELRKQGYSAGYLWIPDYASLSGAKFYSVYIGPYYSQSECEIATDEYRKMHPEAYGLLVSQEHKRVEIKGIGKVSVISN
jgi:hypothetical protein